MRGANGQALGLTSDAAISIFLIESRRLAGPLPTERRCKQCKIGDNLECVTLWASQNQCAVTHSSCVPIR